MRARATTIGDRERISVIIPVHNAESYIDACVRSVLAQGDAALEILLVNDGSTDGSDAICRRLAAEAPTIRYLVQENAGVSAARNAGLAAATGDWILFVDADDLLLPGAIATMRQNMTSHHGMIYYNYRQTLEVGQETAPDVLRAGGTDALQRGDLAASSAGGMTQGRGSRGDSPDADGTVAAAAQDIITASLDYMGALGRYGRTIDLQHSYLTSCWAILYRADLVRDIRFPETLRLSEDLSYNIECLRRCDVVLLVNAPVYYYRVNEDSATHRYTVAQMEQRYAAYDHLLSLELDGEAQMAARSKYIARGLLQMLEHLYRTEDPGRARAAYTVYVRQARIQEVLQSVDGGRLSEGRVQNLYYGCALALLQRGQYAGVLALGDLYARVRRNR